MLAAAFAVAAVLAGCGGGGGTAGPRAPISKVTVIGDSLADVGTFGGARFTVQNSADPNNPFPTFPEIVARNFGVSGMCNFFVATSIGTPPTFANNTRAGCTNFAIGNGRINITPAQAVQQSVVVQLQTAAATAGTYTAGDLVIVDGGGNDAQDLIGAYLNAATQPGNATAAAQYAGLLKTLVDPATVDALLAQGAAGAAQANGLYMQKLADKYYDAISANALAKGATHVAVLNMPDVTLIPGFAPALAAGGVALQSASRAWITAFNDRLAARIGGDGRVALVPFYADLQDEVGNPASYGLTNVKQAACLVALAVSTSGGACTSALLDAHPPTGLTAGWWQTWAFADNLHPTPFGHRLLAASVSRAIARAGWL